MVCSLHKLGAHVQATTVLRGCNNALRWVSVRLAALAACGVLLTPLTAYAGSITLAWNPSPEWWVAGYVVYYGTSPGVYSGSVNVGNQTTAVVNGLTNGVPYYFVVKAYTAFDDFSEPANEANGLPFSQAPTITNPGNMTVKPGAFSLPITASDPDGDPLTYSAPLGLPPGLAMSAQGVISGTVALGTSAAITVTASDGRTTGSVTFTLAVVKSPFTDDPLTPGVHVMRTVHITELRTRIALLRAMHNLPSPWTDNALGSVSTVIKAIHVAELRSALNAVYSARRLQPPIYAEAIVAGSTLIKAAHITELRAAVAAVEQ